ncbi:MAG: gliding motility-associated C-terminal domain-containing protein, partial [Cyclobacteriaceae bacterium]|nr:gliding motility-associated C-terminal domain-containing protein [Cyclobacteriaceae bacterium]
MWASHIVGGEFEMEYKGDFQYTLRMLLYFDVLNGNAGARDDQVLVSIFRKRDDVLVTNISIPFFSVSRVDYFQPSCSNGEVVTDKIIYSIDHYFSPDIYNDPEGYYMVWQRCCRNYTITNVYSNEPPNGLHAGQTFYLEFPPVVTPDGT